MMAQETNNTWCHPLKQLLHGLVEHDIPDCEIEFVTTDSRQVKPGTLFLATPGIKRHGLEFARQAWASGAVAIAFEPGRGVVSPLVPKGRVCLPVTDLSEHISTISGRFFGEPSAAMKICGITGTNGKTTTTHTIAMALRVLGTRCAQMGTLGFGLNEPLTPSNLTTPDAVAVQQRLAWLREQRASHLAMEVSSHALTQFRVSAVQFDCAVFTNLSRDHLDYHGDIGSYAMAKRSLFERFAITGAVVNIDDEVGNVLAHDCNEQVPVTAFGKNIDLLREFSAHLHIQKVVTHGAGLSIHVNGSFGEGQVESSLLGEFNAYNLVAALGVLLHWDVPFSQALSSLASVKSPPGRMESFGREGEALIVVDYAHTPDALLNAVSALRRHCSGTLWCVFGCGGDRDRGKRPMMAQAAAGADHIVVTDDNPRHEESQVIIDEILEGFDDRKAVDVIANREEAIQYAVNGAVAGDIVLIAGKGHEEYQIVGNQRLPFSDREIVSGILRGASHV